MYLTTTRPDNVCSVGLMSRFIESPKDSHWQVGKRILRYVAGTKEYGILYSKTNEFSLIGYSNSDFVGNLEDRRSTSRYIFHCNTASISWASKKKPIVTISSAKEKYVVVTLASCQAIWMRRISKDLLQAQEESTQIFFDNKSAIALSKNHVFHKSSKHIDVRFHFIKELVNNGEIHLDYCRSEEQLADIFTEALPKENFEYLRENLGVIGVEEVKEEC